MNKIITVALIAGGLLLLDSPEAAAHKEVRNIYQPSAYYRFETLRAKRMPNWLKRDRSFLKWYKQTRLRRVRHLAWYQLYNIYRWERINARNYRHGKRGYRPYYVGFNYNRDYYRNNSRTERHGHRH